MKGTAAEAKDSLRSSVHSTAFPICGLSVSARSTTSIGNTAIVTFPAPFTRNVPSATSTLSAFSYVINGTEFFSLTVTGVEGHLRRAFYSGSQS